VTAEATADASDDALAATSASRARRTVHSGLPIDSRSRYTSWTRSNHRETSWSLSNVIAITDSARNGVTSLGRSTLGWLTGSPPIAVVAW
jgi:hypothetical protein